MKDYKKILEGVVDIINTTEKSDIGFANICTYIGENCPELKESEDERIRKELIDIVAKSPITFAFEDKEKVLAWLEKQKVLTTEEDLQGKEDVLWCIKQAKKYAKNENEMGTCWFAEKWLEKQGEQNLIMAKSP